MIYHLNLHNTPFIRIKKGLKTIEMRCHDKEKSLIQVGDKIIFANRDTNEQIKVLVVDIKIYRNFKELYSDYSKKELGYLKEEIADPNDMLQYYTRYKIQKYGVMAIKIRLKK